MGLVQLLLLLLLTAEYCTPISAAPAVPRELAIEDEDLIISPLIRRPVAPIPLQQQSSGGPKRRVDAGEYAEAALPLPLNRPAAGNFSPLPSIGSTAAASITESPIATTTSSSSSPSSAATTPTAPPHPPPTSVPYLPASLLPPALDTEEAALRERLQADQRQLAERHSRLATAQTELRRKLELEAEHRAAARLAAFHRRREALRQHRDHMLAMEAHRKKEMEEREAKLAARRAAAAAKHAAEEAEHELRNAEKMERMRHELAQQTAAFAQARVKNIERRLATGAVVAFSQDSEDGLKKGQ